MEKCKTRKGYANGLVPGWGGFRPVGSLYAPEKRAMEAQQAGIAAANQRSINKVKSGNYESSDLDSVDKLLQNGTIAGLARGGVIPGHDTTGKDDVPVNVTRGEAILPVNTVDALGGPEAVAKLIRATNGKQPSIGMRDDGRHADGAVSKKDEDERQVIAGQSEANPGQPRPPTRNLREFYQLQTQPMMDTLRGAASTVFGPAMRALSSGRPAAAQTKPTPQVPGAPAAARPTAPTSNDELDWSKAKVFTLGEGMNKSPVTRQRPTIQGAAKPKPAPAAPAPAAQSAAPVAQVEQPAEAPAQQTAPGTWSTFGAGGFVPEVGMNPPSTPQGNGYSAAVPGGAVVYGDDAKRIYEGMGSGAAEERRPVEMIYGSRKEMVQPFEGQYLPQGQIDAITGNRLKVGDPMTIGQSGAISKQAADMADRGYQEAAATARTGMQETGATERNAATNAAGLAQQRISTGGTIQAANIANAERNKQLALENNAVTALLKARQSGDPQAIALAAANLDAIRAATATNGDYSGHVVTDEMGAQVPYSLNKKTGKWERASVGGESSQASGYETGKTYTDASGNKAKYLGNGKWQEIK